MGEEPPFDDPIGIAITPPGFPGAFGSPGGLAIADRGAGDDANNAVYFVDPLTDGTGLTFYEEFLVYPSAADLGGQNLNDIESMPGLNEVITAADDGWLFAIDADGYPRLIRPLQLYVDAFRMSRGLPWILKPGVSGSPTTTWTRSGRSIPIEFPVPMTTS